MTLYDVYLQLRECTGREDLARLGVAILAHERGPAGYEAGYGYTDSGPISQWRGRQVEGVCGELKGFFGTSRPVDYTTLRQFWREEWRASDVGWPDKVWRWYQGVNTTPPSAWGGTSIGRGMTLRLPTVEDRLKSLPTVEDRLRGSMSPQVQERLQLSLSQEARRWLLVGLGIMGLAWLWGFRR